MSDRVSGEAEQWAFEPVALSLKPVQTCLQAASVWVALTEHEDKMRQRRNTGPIKGQPQGLEHSRIDQGSSKAEA
eukprot:332431-Pelagomonas_calceolata.AAC.1